MEGKKTESRKEYKGKKKGRKRKRGREGKGRERMVIKKGKMKG